MLKANVYVTLRKSILDPQGVAVKNALKSLGHSEIQSVRIGKFIELELDEVAENEAEAKVKEYCQKLLANEVMEDFKFEIIK
ncbi:MAG: phosphoribosylformylglycinamidine synthase subunit PurS [Calditrichaeota bacterium]|nr:MAG: phosphoribosylformylglycinamidine synthase subunit PurS [Calditrichota bacterium]